MPGKNNPQENLNKCEKEKKHFPVTLIITLIIILSILFHNGYLYFPVEYEEYKDNENADYYYSTLTKSEKKIYTLLDKKIGSMPKKIRLMNDIKLEEFQNAVNALVLDRPIYMMLDSGKYKLICKGKRRDAAFEYSISKEEYEDKKSQVKSKIEEIIINIPKNASSYEKEMYIHDYIIKNCVYSQRDKINKSTAYGALIKGEAVCEGYAEAAKLLLDRVNINCICVRGTSDNKQNIQGHMWNQVQIEDEWYFLDLTWDDPRGEKNVLSRKYFNLRSEDVKESHKSEYAVPLCTATKYNYFVKEGKLFDSYDSAVKEKIAAAFARECGKENIEIKFADMNAYNEAVNRILRKGDIADIINNANSKSKKLKIKDGIVEIMRDEENRTISFFFCYEKK